MKFTFIFPAFYFRSLFPPFIPAFYSLLIFFDGKNSVCNYFENDYRDKIIVRNDGWKIIQKNRSKKYYNKIFCTVEIRVR